MPTKPKRKPRGIVVWVRRSACTCRECRDNIAVALDEEGVSRAPLVAGYKHARRAGCPRLKPGEVKKVRVIIKEVKP